MTAEENGKKVQQALGVLRAPRVSDHSRILAKWRSDIATIHKDVMGLFVARQLYRSLGEIVRSNPALQQPNLLLEWITRSHIVALLVGVRRHTDRDKKSASLYRLIAKLIEQPRAITRKAYVAGYSEAAAANNYAPDLLISMANSDFDNFAQTDASSLDSVRLEADRKQLDDLRAPIGHYVNKNVAHLQPRATRCTPTFKELDDALDLLGKLAKKYFLLFHYVDRGVEAAIQEPWQEILSFPWINPIKSDA